MVFSVLVLSLSLLIMSHQFGITCSIRDLCLNPRSRSGSIRASGDEGKVVNSFLVVLILITILVHSLMFL